MPVVMGHVDSVTVYRSCEVIRGVLAVGGFNLGKTAQFGSVLLHERSDLGTHDLGHPLA